MNFVFRVKEEKRELLGAVTHVDGTARVQTVSKETNRLFWELIDEFRKITGVPILLNTSFNNNAEPIVDSVQDAVVCFLTTKLDYLVVGDYLIKRKDFRFSDYLRMIPALPIHVIISHTKKFISYGEMADTYKMFNNDDDAELHGVEVSGATFQILEEVDGSKTIGELFKAAGLTEEKTEPVLNEILKLWASRYVILNP